MNEMQLPVRRDWRSPVLDHYIEAAMLVRDATVADVVSRCRSRLCYLATPYTKIARHPDGGYCPTGSLEAAAKAARWARLLALEGITAVSPIVQSVEMVNANLINGDLDPLDQVFWENWCRALLRASAVVVVPPIPGWDESDGIWTEVRLALEWQMQVLLIRPGEQYDTSILIGGMHHGG